MEKADTTICLNKKNNEKNITKIIVRLKNLNVIINKIVF